MILRRLLLTFAISLGLLTKAVGMGGLYITKRDFALVPVNVTAPAITGTLKVGSTLTSSFGNWTNSPTSVSYEWDRNGALIPGAMGKTYTLTSTDDGSTLTVTVVAINTAGQSAPSTSAATAVITDVIPTNLTLPVISDTTPTEGQALSVTTGTWTSNPTSYAIQWKTAGLAIAGATNLNYTVQTSDVGNALTVSVAATNSGGTSTTVTSDPTSAVVSATPAVPVNTASPAISGIGQVGQLLTGFDGTWTASPTSYARRWMRNAVTQVSTATTYTPTTSDIGQVLTYDVIATNATGSSARATSGVVPFGIYTGVLAGGPDTLVLSDATHEINHAHITLAGDYITYVTYYPTATHPNPPSIEGNDYRNTSISTYKVGPPNAGQVQVRVPNNSLYVNANPVPWPDSLSFIYITTDPQNGSGIPRRSAIGRHVFGGATSLLYAPSDLSVSDPQVNSDSSAIVMSGDSDLINSLPVTQLYIYKVSNGARTQLTTRSFPVLSPLHAGYYDSHWSHDRTKVASTVLMASGPIFKIIITPVGPAPTYTAGTEIVITAPGSDAAFFGVPEWSPDDSTLVAWLTDPKNRANNGIYSMNSDGTGTPTKISTPPQFYHNTVAFYPSGTSGPTAPLIYSKQGFVIFPAVPVNTIAPAIANTSPQVGDIITSTTGTWSNGPTSYGHQWKSSGTNSAGAGATTASYTVVSGDVGKTLTDTVIGINSGGWGTAVVSNTTAAVTTPGASSFPGQVGNPVGHTAAPGYPGSLTAMSCNGPFTSGVPGTPTVYQFKDFDCGTGGMFLTGVHDIKFFGCRIQSNSTGNSAVSTTPTATDIVFDYVTVQPRVALVGTSPPNPAWPSSSAGLQKIHTPQPNYQIPYANAYQYGFNFSTAAANTGGPYTVTNSDIWGGQNLITLYKTTATILINNNWMHDFADELRVPRTTFTANVTGSGSLQSVAVASSAGFTSFPSGVRASGGLSNTEDLNLTAKADGTHVTGVFTKNHTAGELINSTNSLAPTAHQDGPGYLNAGCCGPSNFTISNNTIAGIANGNLIAWQGGSFSGNNGTFTGNFLSGGAVILALEGVQNTAFTNNTIGTDIPYEFNTVHSNFTTLFSGSGNTWSGNKLRVLAGTAALPGQTPQWTSGQDGFFLLPNGTFSATDF